MRRYLETRGFGVIEAGSLAEAESAFRQASPDVAVIESMLPDGDALEQLPVFRALAPTVPLLVIAAFGSIDLAVHAMQAGAENFLVKPVPPATLGILLDQVLAGRRHQHPSPASAPAGESLSFDPLFGESPAIRELARDVEIALRSAGPILIQGETGTGKGVLARYLHRMGPRRDAPFVDLNCAGLTPEFLESELFGHARGAFTGAVTDKRGLLESADHGTLFLDEIGELGLAVQPRLLTALEEKRFRRMGEVVDRRVDILLICATHHDLVREGTFRNDLFFRISTIPLRVPPLRERVSELPKIAQQIAFELCRNLSLPQVRLSYPAIAALCDYSWPGNLRELRNVLERALLRNPAKFDLGPEDLALDAEPEGASGDTLGELQSHEIERVLRDEHGRVASAARRLGISRSALYQKIREVRLDLTRFQG
jgi:DNA-binding NtrC family response regulator